MPSTGLGLSFYCLALELGLTEELDRTLYCGACGDPANCDELQQIPLLHLSHSLCLSHNSHCISSSSCIRVQYRHLPKSHHILLRGVHVPAVGLTNGISTVSITDFDNNPRHLRVCSIRVSDEGKVPTQAYNGTRKSC